MVSTFILQMHRFGSLQLFLFFLFDQEFGQDGSRNEAEV